MLWNWRDFAKRRRTTQARQTVNFEKRIYDVFSYPYAFSSLQEFVETFDDHARYRFSKTVSCANVISKKQTTAAENSRNCIIPNTYRKPRSACLAFVVLFRAFGIFGGNTRKNRQNLIHGYVFVRRSDFKLGPGSGNPPMGRNGLNVLDRSERIINGTVKIVYSRFNIVTITLESKIYVRLSENRTRVVCITATDTPLIFYRHSFVAYKYI